MERCVGDAVATASGAQRILGPPGSCALCGWTFSVRPRSPGKKETHKVGRNPATQRVALEPDLGGGVPTPASSRFCEGGLPCLSFFICEKAAPCPRSPGSG